MKIVVAGSSGLLGKALVNFLEEKGHEVICYSREKNPGRGRFGWNPEDGSVDAWGMAGADAVVNLSGESLTARRWSASQKAKIRESRINGTLALADAIARLQDRPRIFVSASSIGYYGDRGDQVLTEQDPGGSGFLPGLCRGWEAAANVAESKGVRVVKARFGNVLSTQGGFLHNMLSLFRIGCGAVLGDGSQYVSWISIDDAVRAIHHALVCASLTGPINFVAPNPVTNRQFVEALARVLNSRALISLPPALLRWSHGEMADQVLLASRRAAPERLVESGFEFEHAYLPEALEHLQLSSRPAPACMALRPRGL